MTTDDSAASGAVVLRALHVLVADILVWVVPTLITVVAALTILDHPKKDAAAIVFGLAMNMVWIMVVDDAKRA